MVVAALKMKDARCGPKSAGRSGGYKVLSWLRVSPLLRSLRHCGGLGALRQGL